MPQKRSTTNLPPLTDMESPEMLVVARLSPESLDLEVIRGMLLAQSNTLNHNAPINVAQAMYLLVRASSCLGLKKALNQLLEAVESGHGVEEAKDAARQALHQNRVANW